MSQHTPLSRRDFFRTGAAAGALAMTARSYAQTPGANNRLRMAFIGCGTIATHHLEKLIAIRGEENLELAAVCDVYNKRALDFQGKIQEAGGKADLCNDYRKILERKDIDYVLIATPEHSHSYITLDALDAGKHIYVEKPMTHEIKESQDVVRKVKETGLKLQVGVQGTADDSYATAFEAIKAGKLGKLVQAQIDYVRNYEGPGPWRREGGSSDAAKPADLDWDTWQKPAPLHEWDPHRYYEWRCYSDYSGGVATDLFVHRLTRLIKACGLQFPERVVGMGGIYTWNDGRDLPDSLELLAEYPAMEGITDGMTVHVLGTMANDDGNAHCIRGTDATLTFTETGWEIKSDVTADKDAIIATHKKTGGEDVDPHHRNHHAAIRDGATLNCPAELGLYGVVAVRMGNLSWFNKKMMAWDKEKEVVTMA
jgi:predicted dehydrogenase